MDIFTYRVNKPRITRGNDFKLLIFPRVYVKDSNGLLIEDITIVGTPTVLIKSSNGEVVTSSNRFSFEVKSLNGKERNAVLISVFNQDASSQSQNTLSIGNYAIEIFGKRAGNENFRFYLDSETGFSIVESTPESYIPAESILTYTITGVIGVGQNVGGSDGEANVIEVIKVNGTALTVSNKAVDIIIPSKTSDLLNDSGFLTTHQDISSKENRMPIVTPDSLAFTAETGKYYRISQSGAITVTLPTVQSNYVEGIILFFTASSDDCLSFNSQDSVIFADGYEINAGDICEVNAVFNGGGWQVTVVKFS